MLNHMGWKEAAQLIVKGMSAAIREGRVTYDLARLMQREGRQDVEELGCSGFGEAIVARM
jgi:isocitrate dehydrogenase